MKNLKILKSCFIATLILVQLLSTSVGLGVFTIENPKKSTDGGDIPWVQQDGGPCWAACSANTLAAAGWGEPKPGEGEQNADARAQGIYNLLTGPSCPDFPGGLKDVFDWYLRTQTGCGNSPYYKIQKDPPDPDVVYDYLYSPISGSMCKGAPKAVYPKIKQELEACAYVAAEWYFPYRKQGEAKFTIESHCLTLVAAEDIEDPEGQSGWHDGRGDKENPLGRLDAYNNVWVNECGTNYWELGASNTDWIFYGHERSIVFHVLNPGRPKWATEQYNVAWNDTTLTLVESGYWKDLYDDPYWEENPTKLVVDNIYIEEQEKQLYLELAFDEAQDPNVVDLASLIEVGSEQSVELRGGWHWYDDNKSALAKYVIDPQPASEWILFDADLLADLDNFNVATYCIPEPATVLVLGLGGLVLVRRRRG